MAPSQPSEKADPSPDNITVPNVQSSSSAMAPSETAAAKDLATAPSGAALSAPSTAANSPTSPPPADPTVPNMDIAGSVMSNVYHLLATIMSHVKLTGLLVVGIVTSTVITHFAGIYPALAVDIVLLWALGRVWRREMSVFKVNIREELRRQQGLYKMDTDEETAEWFNLLLARFWLIFEPMISEIVIGSVNPILEYYTPGFVDSLQLSEFTLGTTAPRLNMFRGIHRTDDDIVRFDCDASFVPKDVDDLQTGKDERNSRIVLSTRIGRGVVAVDVPVLVKEISFHGTVSIQLKLMSGYPYVKILTLGMPRAPRVDFVLKPLKGVDLMDTPGLSNFMHSLIDQIIAMLFVTPNSLVLDLDALLNYVPNNDSAIGVLCLKLYEAKDLKNVEILGNMSDPYANIRLGGLSVAKSRVISANLNPYWNETFYLLVRSLNDAFEIVVVDKEVLRDRPLGTYKGTLADYDFETTPKHEDVVKQLRDAKSEGKDKSRGEVRFDVAYYPVPTAPAIGAAAELVSSYEATHGSSQSGILRVTIHQAKELDTSKAVAGQLSAFVELQYNKVFMGKTPVKKRSNVPYWEWSNELFIRNAVIDRVRFTIRDQRDLLHDTELGYCELTLREILKMLKAPATVPRREWWTVRGSATGKMRLSFTWTPIGFDHIVPPLSVGGKAPLVPAMGVVRLRVIEAKALANKEAVGLSDPYVLVSYAGKPRACTAVIDNTLEPLWNEQHYILLHDTALRGKLKLEVFDFNNLGKDKLMGMAQLDLKTLSSAKTDMLRDDGTPYYDVLDLWLGVTLDKGRREAGKLHVEVTYYEVKAPPVAQLLGSSTPNLSPETVRSEPFNARRGSRADDASKSPAPSLPLSTKTPTGSPRKLPPLSVDVDDAVPLPEKDFAAVLQDLSAGIIRISVRELTLVDRANKKAPQPYFEVLDISSSLVGNDAFDLQESNTIEAREVREKPSGISGFMTATKLRKKGLRDLDKLMLSLASSGSTAEKKTIEEITLLHRTSVSKNAAEYQFDEDMEFLIKDLDRARVLFVCKDYQVAKIVPNVPIPGMIGSNAGKSDDKLEDVAKESPSFKRLTHPIIGTFNLELKPFLVQLAESGLLNEGIPCTKTMDLMSLPDGEPSGNAKKSSQSIAGSISTVIGTVQIEVSFAPILLDEGALLDEQELKATDSGQLQVELIAAENLPGVDRSGTSDPYCVFRVNSARVHKSKVVKRDCNPQFNETFTIPLPSRRTSRIVVEVCDWNQFDERELLGLLSLNGGELVPNETVDQAYTLLDEQGKLVYSSNKKTPSTILLKTTFRPDNKMFVAKPRRRSSNKISAKQVIGGVIDMTGDAVAVAGTVGLAALKFSRGRTEKNLEELQSAAKTLSPVVALSNGSKAGSLASVASSSKQDGSVLVVAPPVKSQLRETVTSTDVSSPVANVEGSLVITIVEAKDLLPADSNGLADPYVKVRVKETTVASVMDEKSNRNDDVNTLKYAFKTKIIKKTLTPSWNESMTRHAKSGDALVLQFDIKDSNLLQSKDMGNTECSVWEVLSSAADAGSADATGALRADTWLPVTTVDGDAAGSLRVKLEFTPSVEVPKSTEGQRVREASADVASVGSSVMAKSKNPLSNMFRRRSSIGGSSAGVQ